MEGRLNMELAQGSKSVVIRAGEFGNVDLGIRNNTTHEYAHIQLSQVEALSLAKMLEEQVKDNRRK